MATPLAHAIRKSVLWEMSPPSGKAKAAVQGAEGRSIAEEAGHVRIHRGDGQVVRTAAAKAKALEDGAGQGGGNHI